MTLTWKFIWVKWTSTVGTFSYPPCNLLSSVLPDPANISPGMLSSSCIMCQENLAERGNCERLYITARGHYRRLSWWVILCFVFKILNMLECIESTWLLVVKTKHAFCFDSSSAARLITNCLTTGTQVQLAYWLGVVTWQILIQCIRIYHVTDTPEKHENIHNICLH